MSLSVEIGAIAGVAVLVLCCLTGIVVFAMRASGKVRRFGVLGCALILLERLLGIGTTSAPLLWMGFASSSVLWTVTILTTVLKTAGLVSLGLSFMSSRHNGLKESPGHGDRGQSEVMQ